ncbi:hypothetical protein Cgig2_023820 [Carnegiea gigantea]|uniref:Uncharacterized protein n=1 Tax=Carnegiea gigantea TaxID=171969 RepID=A0A9Q1JYG5_9CARY|nr:hypothetical protein Cgig2_023820 [Carnegiea gigantea]
MACSKLLFLTKRFDYPYWTVTMETGFGGSLSIRMLTIPKHLAPWLLEIFDLANNTLKLSNNIMLETIKEHVHATLPFLMGPLEVQVASTCEPKNEYTKVLNQYGTRWNLGRSGTPTVGKIVEQILEGGDHEEEIKRDFVLYMILTFILRELNLEERDAKTNGFNH